MSNTATHLVIVESPAKAKTIKKHMGAHYHILASYGHVRDLLPKEGAVDPAQQFAMRYELIEKNEKHVTAIINAMKKSDALYLATDPDREGEAIAWHVYTILKAKKVLGKKPVHRIVFHEITRSAIQAALTHPRDISMNLVNAQQARRALDYLVGFTLSPLLWKKVRYGLSAGRVQSPALCLIVSREEEIEKFISREYWDLTATCEADHTPFQAKLVTYNNKKLEQFDIINATDAENIKQTLLTAANGLLTVTHIEKKQRKRHPAAPFITSTLQQEAARKLGFAVQRTMRLAQQLYEGIELESGLTGLITYMRTDSVVLSNEAIAELRAWIAERYGKNQVPDESRVYKTKAKNAQEAHEAIRPASITRTPESIKSFLSDEQFKLYDIIWKRTVASQMISASIDTIAVDLHATDKHHFRSTGSTVTDPGYMQVYQEGLDDKPEEAQDTWLPPLKEGDRLPLKEISCNQHFTEPPPRYSEASLIKALEEYGIGRPSTYAAIVSTLQTREYVVLDNKRFHPTDIGRVVSKFLRQYFTRYVDYDFTAKLEDELDDISRGEKEWVPLLQTFWDPFKNQIDTIAETVKKQDVTQEKLNENCPECGKVLCMRLGKRDRFIGCSGYPECTYTRSLTEDAKDTKAAAEFIEGRTCPDCGQALKMRQSKFGKFIGCSGYPKCKFTESYQDTNAPHVECPECKQGNMLKRQSRRGKIFFSCSRYPECKYAVWNEPIAKSCPRCAWPMMTIKHTKKKGTEWVCPRKTCGYAENAPESHSQEDN